MSEEQKKENAPVEETLMDSTDEVVEKPSDETTEGETVNVVEDASAPLETTEPPGKKWLDRFSAKQKKLFVIVAVVAAALLAGLGTYNSKENRLRRQLDLGYRYLENEQYEEAVIAFERAIEIDERCIEAYAGGIQGYQNMDKPEEFKVFYDKAQTVVQTLEAEALAESLDHVVDIYLATEDVYGDDPERVAELLEEGLEKTGQNSEVKKALVDTYIGLAETYTRKEGYDQGLSIYDRLLELDGANERVQADLGNCLQNYFEVLKEERSYEKIRALVGKYQDALPGIDFSAVLAEVDALEQQEAQNRAFMEKVYNLMAAQDYEGMHGVDGSEEAAAFAEAMPGNRYVYFPEENESRSGTGAGVYKFGDGGYYFYYGDYVDGSKEGSGVSFCNDTNAGYSVFTGAWADDAPNGTGEILSYGAYASSGMRYSKVTTGNFVNGLCDGYMDCQISDYRGTFDMPYTAERGIPTEDKTKEYIRTYIAMGDWDPMNPVYIPEGHYIYAYGGNTATGESVYFWVGQGETVGVTGFAGLE